MAKRRAGTDWSGLTRLIEHHLSGLPGFPAKVRVETKLQFHSPGIYHDNYFFAAAGRELLLRMAKRFRPQRTAAESSAALAREAETLQVVARCGLAYPAPRLVCVVTDDAGKTVGLIETCLEGAPLSASISADGDFRLRSCAEVAARVHQLPVTAFCHLPACADSAAHVIAELEALPPELFTGWPVAAAGRDWITAHLPARPAAILHGDLLPQNLLWDLLGTGGISVIDWECARIGDPAYDLAIVTRGVRKPLGEPHGLPRLLDFYNAAARSPLTVSDVRVHELLLHLRWLAEAARDAAAGRLQGHGPEHYALQLAALLRRSG